MERQVATLFAEDANGRLAESRLLEDQQDREEVPRFFLGLTALVRGIYRAT